MDSLRKAWVLARLVAHLLGGLLLALLAWPLIGTPQRKRTEQWFAKKLLSILKVQVQASYESTQANYALHGPYLLYSNHVSWLDIFAFNAVEPVTFIAKAEISKWPIGGTLAKRSGTLFIERGKRHAVRDVIQAAVQVIKTGRSVAVFPEGTTGTGQTPLNFHSNFVQPAIMAGVPLLPVSLQYCSTDGRFSEEPAFVGEQTLMQNIAVLLNSPKGYVVKLHFHHPMPTEGQTRHDLSDLAYTQIAAHLAGNLD
ncbi:lysophospholipid acyltransferase family protein [Limnobacter sp.]|uniref:lysophospholipid acyltransferase family protein n=1 Tax=Limnobacter sp. TaxID=2003368 RepID=UPI003511AAA0